MCKVLRTGCLMGGGGFPGIGSREERLHTGDCITIGSTKNETMLRLRSLQQGVRLLLELLRRPRRQALSAQSLHLLHHARRHRTVQMRGAGQLGTQRSEQVLPLLPRGQARHQLGITKCHQDLQGGTYSHRKIGGFKIG